MREGLSFVVLGNLSFVVRGLDPRIHEAAHRAQHYGLRPLRFIMDCRIKSGNDGGKCCGSVPT